jgi:Protein kinase domain/Tetratricopeptide repeat
VAVPKIVDFGIAKATQAELTEKTVFTRFHQFLGTPAYMSPEQAEMTSLDIDTRSDIYSLGVLLYELLTGKTPFDTNELLKAGLDEMRRTIREVEPVKPSTRLTQDGAADVRRLTSKSEIRNPKSEIDKDLDWIVMKCLEKDRARRYETANGLASDIQRHLNNEPVVACPASKLYKFQKLVRRNKLAFAAGAAIAAALVLGLCVALRRKLLGNDGVDVADSLASLASILERQGKLSEAETVCRECLAVREAKTRDHWRVFEGRSLLGASLMGQKKYADAEPLLLSGYEGLKQREDKLPTAIRPRLQPAIRRLVRLYEETNRPDQAAEWKQRLAELEKVQ